MLHDGAQVEARECVFAGGAAHAGALLRGQRGEFRHGLAERVLVARRRQVTGAAGESGFGNSSHFGRDTGQRARRRFQQNHRQSFDGGGEHQRVGGVHQVGNVRARAQKAHVGRRGGAQDGIVGACACDQQHGARLAPHGAQQQGVILLPHETAYREPDESGTQFQARRDAGADIRFGADPSVPTPPGMTGALAEATVFVSTAAAGRHLQAHAVSAARARVIPNGVDTDRFRPDPDVRARTRAGLELGSGFVWLAVGRLMWKKNYPLLLRAMRRQPGAVLLIAGAGPDDAVLRAAAPPNVRFLGARADIPDLMNAADALVLTSAVEGLPMVLLEAAASALPCVATEVGGVPEAVLPGRTGYLSPPGDEDALSQAMAKLAALPAEERAGVGRAAREYALARFDLRAIVEQWERLYGVLLAEES